MAKLKNKQHFVGCFSDGWYSLLIIFLVLMGKSAGIFFVWYRALFLTTDLTSKCLCCANKVLEYHILSNQLTSQKLYAVLADMLQFTAFFQAHSVTRLSKLYFNLSVLCNNEFKLLCIAKRAAFARYKRCDNWKNTRICRGIHLKSAMRSYATRR